MRAHHPTVDVTLGFSADAPDADERLRSADLRLFSTDGERPGGEVAIPLYHWDPVALVGPDHPILQQSGAITLEALAAFPLITYDNLRTAPLSIARTFVDAGLRPRFAFTARDANLIKAAVRAGAGIGLLAEMAVDPVRADQDLRVIPLAGLLPRCTTWAVLRRDCVLRDCLVHLLVSLSGLSPMTIRRVVTGDVALETAFTAVRTWPEVARSLGRTAGEMPRLSVPTTLHPVFQVALGTGSPEGSRRLHELV